MRGSRLLQVSGILMIVFAAISLVTNLIGVFGGGGLLGAAAGNVGAGMAVVFIGSIGSIISGVIMLIAGILGAKNWATPPKAGGCVAMGIIMVVLNLISGISNIVNNGAAVAIVGFVISMVLPVLYLAGAMQLKKTA